MRSGRTVAVAVAVGALVAGACGGDESADRARELRRQSAGEELEIKGVPEDKKVPGNVVTLELSGAGVKIVDADGDTSGKTGHYHVFVDHDPVPFGQVVPKAPYVMHSSEDEVDITGLAVGSHTVTVVLGDGNHRRIGEKAAEVQFDVQGPSLRADAPAKVERKQAVPVHVTVEGVTLGPPNGDTSGATGHADVFVDREPTAAGQPVPTEYGIVHGDGPTVSVEGLAAGEHFLWVVLSKGDHSPFEPQVAHKIIVMVGD